MPKTSSYNKTVLPGGIRVVSERIPGVRSVSLGIWVIVGSRFETAAENGLSHFIEHMAFKGTQTRSALDIARSIEQGGGLVNAFTGKEMTCYYVHVIDERMPLALDILADVMRDSVFDPGEIEKEKQVILDEIRDHEDMPDDVCHERFIRELFGKHPIARPILGPPRNVKGFTRDDLIRYIDKHYLPSRIVVAAAGNLQHRALTRMVEDKLGFAKRGKAVKSERIGKLTRKLRRFPRPIQQAHMVMGTRGLPYGSLDRFTMSVMNTVLGGGMSSRLFQNIREKHGVCYSIYSFTDSMADTGAVGVYLATDRERVDKARKLVLKEFEALRETPLTKAEIDGVKTQLKGNIMLGLENVSNRMMRLGRMEIYLGRYHSLEDVSRQIDVVTPAKVQKLARQLWTADRMVTTIVEPERKRKSAQPARRT
ncbi:insulinase family protein [candidate division KSB1 bacterium]|nr:insulinase family protein [candidate division KSB1 bacterium]